mgnify:CR=1 FL=1
MLELLSILPLAQIVAPPPNTLPPQFAREVVRPQEVRLLPGQLDTIPVFNSNSPEVIISDGILLSTFPPDGMRSPEAHLNWPLSGRFDVFAHHVARGVDANDIRTLYIAVIAYNPTNQPINVDVLQAASYLSQEAPFRDLPSYVANPLGTVFSGPGSRTMNDVLRGQRQPGWPDRIVVPPRGAQFLFNLPIPLRSLASFQNGDPLPQYLLPFPLPGSIPPVLPELPLPGSGAMSVPPTPPAPPGPPPIGNRQPPTNGRTVLMHLQSDGPLYLASLAMHAPINPNGTERPPTLWEWRDLLLNSQLAGPRDIPPTDPEFDYFTRFFYGRVAGIAQGSQWIAQITDSSDSETLSIPSPGSAIAYPISTLDRGTFGTGQIQSAPILVRYPDTAYRAHGNYGILYSLTLPLENNTGQPQRVSVLFQTPVKDEDEDEALRFLNPPDNQVFFRGTLRLRFNDDFGVPVTRYLHIVQRRGQEGEPLIRLNMEPGDRRLVQVDFIYPPDATPPQVLTIQTDEAAPRFANP